jgi:hypothetical protein
VLAGTAAPTPVAELGLRGRGVVYIADGQMIQLIHRSSRVLRKDAERFWVILESAASKEAVSLQGVVLVKKAPICSKARAWLENRGVLVESIAP